MKTFFSLWTLLAPLFSHVFLSKVAADTECPNVQTPAQDRRIDPSLLRIVQYNVEWLFVDEYSASACPGDGCTWKNESEAETHLKYVSQVVANLNPDIINFCEVEGCDELNMVLQYLNQVYPDQYRPYLIKGTDTSTGQNVGLLTKVDPSVTSLVRTEDRYQYPVVNSTCGYLGTPSTTGVSKHYITEYHIGDLYIAWIAAHLLAKPTDPTRCAEREAQAMVLQSVIDYYINDLDYEVIMIGDFNDFDDEVLDLNNNVPTSRVLDILKGRSLEEESGAEPGSQLYQLYSIAETIVQEERYSDWWDPNGDCVAESTEFSMIDHILVTDALRQRITNTYIYHGYSEYCGKYNSDHYPVVVELLL